MVNYSKSTEDQKASAVMPMWLCATLTHSERNWTNSLDLPAGSPNPHRPHFNQAFFFLWFSNLEIKICTPKHRLSSALSWTSMVSVEWNHSGTRFSEKIIADFLPVDVKVSERFASEGEFFHMDNCQVCVEIKVGTECPLLPPGCVCPDTLQVVGAGRVLALWWSCARPVCAPKRWALCHQKTLRPCRTSWMTSQQSVSIV